MVVKAEMPIVFVVVGEDMVVVIALKCAGPIGGHVDRRLVVVVWTPSNMSTHERHCMLVKSEESKHTI